MDQCSLKDQVEETFSFFLLLLAREFWFLDFYSAFKHMI